MLRATRPSTVIGPTLALTVSNWPALSWDPDPRGDYEIARHALEVRAVAIQNTCVSAPLSWV